MSGKPLSGVRILDLGAAWAIPIATRHLAMLGAEVIHIESCARPDVSRYGQHAENTTEGRFWETGGRHNHINMNKKAITLDLTRDEGVHLFKELVKISDVVAENFSPRVMRNLGLHYEALREIRPDLIMISSSGFGHSGPWAHYGAWGMGMEPTGGISHFTGYTEGRPIKSGIPYTDIPSAMHGTLAMLIALDYRRRSGEGQFIDLSQNEVSVQQIGEAIMDYTMNGRAQARMGNRHPSMAPHGCYRSQGNDKWIAIAVSSDEEWQALCHAMGDPPWSSEERFKDALSRWHNQDELDRLIEEWTEARDHHETMHTLQRAGVPCGAVLTPKELFLDPHYRERGYIQMVAHPREEGMEHLGTRPYIGFPWKMSRTETTLERSPILGEHNEYVFGELLGLPREEMEKLEREGIIGREPLSMEPTSVGSTTVPLSLMKEMGRIEEWDEDFHQILGLDTGPP